MVWCNTYGFFSLRCPRVVHFPNSLWRAFEYAVSGFGSVSVINVANFTAIVVSKNVRRKVMIYGGFCLFYANLDSLLCSCKRLFGRRIVLLNKIFHVGHNFFSRVTYSVYWCSSTTSSLVNRQLILWFCGYICLVLLSKEWKFFRKVLQRCQCRLEILNMILFW